MDKELFERIAITQKHMKMQNSNRREIDQLENYLSVDIDEKALAKLYRNIKISWGRDNEDGS